MIKSILLKDSKIRLFLAFVAMMVVTIVAHAQTLDSIILDDGELKYIYSNTYFNSETDYFTSDRGVIYDDGGPTGNMSVNFRSSVYIFTKPGDTIRVWGSVDISPDSYLYTLTKFRYNYTSYMGVDTISVESTSGRIMIDISDYSYTDTVYSGFELHYEIRHSNCAYPIGDFAHGERRASSVDLYWDEADISTRAYVLGWAPYNPTTGVAGTFQYTRVNGTYYHNLTNLQRDTWYTATLVSVADSGSAFCTDTAVFKTSSCENRINSVSVNEANPTSLLIGWSDSANVGPYVVTFNGHDTTVASNTCLFTGLQPNTSYSVTVVAEEDTCCSNCSFSITAHTICYQANVSGLRPLLGNDAITITADEADGYLWSTGATTRSITVSQAGYYNLVVFTNGGCTDTLVFGVSNVELGIDIDIPSELCPGETAAVNVGFGSGATVIIDPGDVSSMSDPTRIFLPDGINCDPSSDHGCSYRSELEFNGFGNYQLMTNVNDIQYVMLNIEHSYIGDLYINITCPNGQNADILKFSGFGGSECTGNIGYEHRGWATGSNGTAYSFGRCVDEENTDFPCDSTAEGNEAGVGYRYCWSNNSQSGYTYAPGDGLIYRLINASHNEPYSSFDSSDVAAGTNFYHPDQSLRSLVGCPMNGNWYIEVIDGWGVDNGYIFGWELALNPERLTRNSYTPSLASADLDGAFYRRTTDTTFTITAPYGRTTDTTVTYTVTIHDQQGNTFDTTFTVTFHSYLRGNLNETIVQNQLPWTTHGHTFTTDTSYVFQVANEGRCDSIVNYTLHIIDNTGSVHDTTVCDNTLPVTWHGLSFNEAGTQYLTITNSLGADSVLTINLHVAPSYQYSLSETICSNHPYTFEGTTYSATGTYTHSLTTSAGCDSLRTLDLTVYPVVQQDTAANVCDQFTWRGTTYYQSQTVTLNYPGGTPEGCDSVSVLALTIRHSDTTNLVQSACDSLVWNGQHFTQSTSNATYLTTNSVGCDSLVTLALTIYPSYDLAFTQSTCSNYPYTFEGTTYSATGTYTHSLTTSAGCDSLRTLALTVYPVVQQDTSANVCDQFTWRGTTYYQSQTVTLNYPGGTPEGCDSVSVLALTIRHSDTTNLVQTACDSLDWNGYHFTRSTSNARHFTTNSVGCDSLVTLDLTIVPSYHLDFSQTTCSNYPYTFEGTTYSATGTYPHSFTTADGCDSIRTLNLTVNPTTSYDTLASACTSFTWYGNTYLADTTVSRILTGANSNGCDSTVNLILSIYPVFNQTFSQTICENQSYTFCGTTYSQPGSYTHQLTSSHGCDSVVTLALTVNDTSVYDTTITRCDTYTWNGRTFTSSADSVLLYTNAVGCDSTFNLHVVINHSDSETVYDTIVENQLTPRYSWRDTSFSSAAISGTYLFHRQNVYGCDSTVTYHLMIWPNVATSYDSNYCASDNNTGIARVDTIRRNLTTIHGADSLVTITAYGHPVYHNQVDDTTCDNQPYTFFDTTLTTAGAYNEMLTTIQGCDSLITLILTVNPTYKVITYDTIYLGDTITFHDQLFHEPGIYDVSYVTQLGCDSVFTLNLTGRNMHIRYITDSLCQGDSLLFFSRHLYTEGVYRDTIVTGDFYLGDTIVELTLAVVTPPIVTIDTSYVCHPDPQYTLAGHTDAPYITWSSAPYDDDLSLQLHDSTIYVNPSDTSVYYLTADYRATRLCPGIDSVIILPIESVHASIEVVPGSITLEDRHITAYNRSTGRYQQYTWYVWYDGYQAATDHSTILTLDVPATVDSVQISLLVESRTCTDITTVDVPILRSGIFFPTVFTPSKDENNIFQGIGSGVLGYEIWIYDRRGDLVYHSTDISEGWDGTKEGVRCQQGNYVYFCRYTDQITPNGWQTTRGSVILLR